MSLSASWGEASSYEGAPTEVRNKVKSDAATADGATHAMTASYQYFRDINETDLEHRGSVDVGRRQPRSSRPLPARRGSVRSPWRRWSDGGSAKRAHLAAQRFHSHGAWSIARCPGPRLITIEHLSSDYECRIHLRPPHPSGLALELAARHHPGRHRRLPRTRVTVVAAVERGRGDQPDTSRMSPATRTCTRSASPGR